MPKSILRAHGGSRNTRCFKESMIIDSHVHFGALDARDRLETLYEKMTGEMDANGIDRFCIAVSGGYPKRQGLTTLADALWFKWRAPERVYVFGSLDWTGLPERGEPETPLLDQLEQLRAAGCDGLKLLTGKPDCRKALGHALDDAAFEPVYAWLEKTGLPCLWHIADPPEFWNESTTPLWARRNGWWYDATHPAKAQIDAEAYRVFRRHPKMKLALAHFFFLSQDLEAAAALLDEFPEIRLDLAPGVEMLHTFTRDPATARAFFEKYASRILYGTDSGMGAHATGPKRGWMVRHWLETTETFEVPDDPFMLPDDRTVLKGIGLSAETLARIYAGNFLAMLGGRGPRPLKRAPLKRLCEELAACAERRGREDAAARAVLTLLRGVGKLRPGGRP